MCVWPFIRKIIDRFSYLSHRMTVYRKPAALSTVTIGTNLSLSVALSLSVSRDSFISYLLWAIKLFEVIKFILYMITVFQLPLMTIITPNFKPIRFSHFWYQQYCTMCLPGRYVLCAICTLQCALVFRGRVNRLCDFMCWFSLSKTASHTFFSISIRWSYALRYAHSCRLNSFATRSLSMSCCEFVWSIAYAKSLWTNALKAMKFMIYVLIIDLHT